MNEPNHQLDEDQNSTGIPAPSVGEFLRPRWFLGFLRAFVGSWFLTRNYRAFFAGAPALLFAFVGAAVVWRLAQPPDETLAASYERAAVKATELESHEESDLMWERLMQLRPDDHRYRFVLAQSLADRGDLAEAARHLEVLTAEDGFTPARLWLVRQSREESPSFPLDTEQQIGQLQAAVQAEPQNTDAHRMLAQTYIEREDYRLAEQHLLHAAKSHPTLGLLLYELQTKMGRDDVEQSRRYLQDASRGFEDLAIENPRNPEPRIYWAQTLELLGRPGEAEAVLTEALRSIDVPELRAAASTFMVRQAQRLINQSPLNAQIAAQYADKAIRINPTDPTLPSVCIALLGLGAEIPAETVAPVIENLQTLLEKDPSVMQNRLLLANLLTQQDRLDETVQLLEPHQDDNPGVQSMLIRAYRQNGRDDAADRLSRTMLTSLRDQVSESSEPEAIIQLAGALISTREFESAVNAIDDWAERSELPLYELPQQLTQFYIAACVAAYREMTAADADAGKSFNMLKKATETRLVTTELLQILARLTYHDPRVTSEANELLTKFIAGGQANAQIYAALGTEALTGNHADDAVRYLRLALSRAPRNAVVQNNLALALIRQSTDNAGQAIELCNDALETMPGQPDVLSTRAEIQIARSRWPEARIDLETVLPQRPQSQLVRRLLVKVYTELNEPKLAAEHQRVLDQLVQAEENAAGADTTGDETEAP